MDSVTPVNRSRIPRVNSSAPRLGRTASYADDTNNSGIISGIMPRTQPPTGGKSTNTLPQERAVRLKRSAPAAENVPCKRQAMAPPSNQKGKLPPWDFKGKLKVAEDRILKLKESLDSHKLEVAQRKQRSEIMEQQYNYLEAELKEKSECLESEKRLRMEYYERAEKLQLRCDEAEHIQRATLLSLETTKQSLNMKEERINLLSCELEQLRSSSYQRESAFTNQSERLLDTEKCLEQLRKKCCSLEEKVSVYEVQRKVLHNKVMELKGNIRVFCRVRPLLPAESGNTVEHLHFCDETSLEVYKGPKKLNKFSFDRVFPPDSTQAHIFEDLSELVQSVIDGYNVCVFAYGQTGSGKTYTMEGGLGEEVRGMIPRSVDLIFAKLEELTQVGRQYEVEASFVEIYNEQVHDLLESGQSEKSCEIRNPTSPGGDMVVTNVKVETVKSAVEAYKFLNIARTNRAVAATVHNDHSSRSHFVFKLRLKVSAGNSGKGSDSVLSLVDLAGSEKLVDISDTTRMTETKNINKSLSNLGNVILALSNKNEHVPYRNSKLTHLLQPSLGGNSKTLMMINLSPRDECVDETLNSLRFATRVSECHIGQAQKKIK